MKINWQQGVMHISFEKNFLLDIEKAHTCLEKRLQYNKKESYPIILDLRNVKKITFEAMIFLSKKKALQKLVCGAFVINSRIEKSVLNIFFALIPQFIPSKIFHNTEDARLWIAEIKRKEEEEYQNNIIIG